MSTPQAEGGFVARLIAAFLHGNLSVLIILVMLGAGAAALLLTPREEEPQIVVPLADIYVRMPGASAEEVEQLVSSRLERLLYQVDGVEYVYSMSRPGGAVVTVRFYVGEHRENSLVKLHNKITMNIDQVPPGVTGWVVKPVEIDDVPFFNVTLWSRTADDFTLRRVAEQVEVALQDVPDTARTEVVGGRRRQLRIELDPERMASRQVTPLDVDRVLRGANVSVQAGALRAGNRETAVESGPFLQTTREAETLVVGVFAGRPVYLRDVATVTDGPEEPTTVTRISFGPGESSAPRTGDFPAVTVGVAKRKGSNAVAVARALEARTEELRRDIIPHDVEVRVTRNNGETADEKVTELIRELGLAIVIVSALIMFSLGWREAIIVVTAVPLTFALTLLVNYLAGYSINRVTLFALILALGLVVDDPIVDVENIFRHFGLRRKPPKEAVLEAVNEVRPPIIVATLVVMVSFLPMLFITGMMGPYMRPMALNVPVAMFMSMVVAFTVTPWLSYQVLKGVYGKGGHEPVDPQTTFTYRAYRAVLTPFLNSRRAAWGLIGLTLVLLLGSMALPALGLVPLKMLPFDNKNEFQVLVDLPEGSTVEQTDAVLKALADEVRAAPEVREVLSYAGTASPMDFNGMVRHYYLRQEAHRGDLRVNLIPKEERKQQSHAIVLRLRSPLQAVADRHGARIKVVEVPPGPPVLSTLVAEVYPKVGQDYASLRADAKHVRSLFATAQEVVDVDDTFEAERPRYVFRVDKEKASLTGVTTEQIANTLRVGLQGMQPGEGNVQDFRAGAAHLPRELNPLAIVLQLPQRERGSLTDLARLGVKTPAGEIVHLGELGRFEPEAAEQTIYHKNLRRVAYVSGDTAGRTPGEAVIGLLFALRDSPTPNGADVVWTGEGEWKITLDVFRDLGLAFAGALLFIYILMVYQTGSYLIPLVQMISIPLTIIGIMPGFWLLNVATGSTVGGYVNPVYFTATAMIGMIALAGIADRNAILLLDFIQHVRARGAGLKEALVESGAVRLRPILLTAGAAMLGAWPITLDPVFSGLAWSLIFGLVVSTAFTLVLVPVVYWMLYRDDVRPTMPTEPPGV
ncbi:MAG TPA: efflux RND transporter permease subunit [Gemmataceae bacterium]|nr:efflux RND transporter permease subunit [Gemmataceae bacterium]